MARMLLAVLAVFIWACQSPESPAKKTGTNIAHDFDCNPYEGVEEVLAKAETHVIVLGEAIHGTHQGPDAQYSLACAMAQQGLPVLVGFEASHKFTNGLNAYLDEPVQIDRLFEKTRGMWVVHDGRSSGAILELLQRLAALRAHGAAVSVFAFDTGLEDYTGEADWGVVGRDAVMASQVDKAVDGLDGGVVLLTGGFHARKEPFVFDETTFVPMGSKIISRPVLSLDMRHAGGTGWMWGEIDGETYIGPHELRNLLPEGAPVRAISFEPTEQGSDGVYFTGPITASPPAFPAVENASLGVVPDFDCNPYDGVEEVLAKAETHIIILGEMHGTNEGPDAFYSLICALAERGVPVRVGLEISWDHSDTLNAFLDRPSDVDWLREQTHPFWTYGDGRSSTAILKLLQDVADLRGAGMALELFGFDSTTAQIGTDIDAYIFGGAEAAMAENVDTESANFEGAIVLLVGSTHAQETTVEYDGREYLPMAGKIESRPTLSLNMYYQTGTAWVHMTRNGESTQGETELSSGLGPDTPVRAFDLSDSPHGYDGVYYTGPITASPPAFPTAETP